MPKARNIDLSSRAFLEDLLKSKNLKLEITKTNLNVRTEDDRLIVSAELHGTIEDSCRQLTTKLFREYGNKSSKG